MMTIIIPYCEVILYISFDVCFAAQQELSPDKKTEFEKKIKFLKEELRNEEMKLIVLKKLRLSQLLKENIPILQVNHPNVTRPSPASHSVSNQLSSSAHRSSPTPQNKPSSVISSVLPLLKGVSKLIICMINFRRSLKKKKKDKNN